MATGWANPDYNKDGSQQKARGGGESSPTSKPSRARKLPICLVPPDHPSADVRTQVVI